MDSEAHSQLVRRPPLTKKGLRRRGNSWPYSSARPKTSPDEKGIKTRLGRRDIDFHLVRRPPLTKKGLRLYFQIIPVFAVRVRRPPLTKKGLRHIIHLSFRFVSDVRRPPLTKKGLRRVKAHDAGFCPPCPKTSPDEKGIKTSQ